jgi:hypothetical protein
MDMRILLEGLQNGTAQGGGNGRRLLFTEGFELKNSDHSSPELRDKLDQFRALAENMLLEPITVIPYRLYKLFDTTGEREQFQQAYFDRRKRLDVFAILSIADGNARYVAERAEKPDSRKSAPSYCAARK